MNCESRITPEEAAGFAAAATALIDDRLALLGEPARSAYWNAVLKAYNTPYNVPLTKAHAARKHGNLAAVGTAMTSAAETAIGSVAGPVQCDSLTDVQAA